MTTENTTAPVAIKRPLLTPFNVIAGIIILIGLPLTYLRFTGGLGAVSNLDNNNPWGFWIGFDLLTGVALAAGGYVTAAAVELFGKKEYHSAVRPAILTGFLGYSLVVFALLYDVGRPWRLPYPFFVSQGVTSIMFEVGACVALYLTVLFLEFSPAALEWLGAKKLRRVVVRLTIGLTILGVVLSTLHQSSLGAMYLIAPSKLHPLWYSPYLPIFFFVSSIAAGLSMVIFEGSLSYRNFSDIMDEDHRKNRNRVVLGFGKAASLVLAGYFAIKVFGVALGNHWHLLSTPYGLWFLVEMIGFILLPCFAYAIGVRDRNVKLIRWTALWTVLGIVLNRLNITLFTFNWQLPADQRYSPHWMEIGISVFVVTIGVVVFKFIVTHMPIFYEHPDYKEAH
ncbi:MAG: polysulfide reductase NrfD [candidate division Zixibacteria bacterium]|nr:polysulfide reductase NrfD [candidate division Zixibacteria bacterium]